MGDLTSDQLAAGISNAIKARDWDAVVDMLRALTFIDPQLAQDIYDILARVSFAEAT